MSCKNNGGCGNCDNCPEKAAEAVAEGKRVLKLWKSIFKKALEADAMAAKLLTKEEEELVRKQLADFEAA